MTETWRLWQANRAARSTLPSRLGAVLASAPGSGRIPRLEEANKDPFDSADGRALLQVFDALLELEVRRAALFDLAMVDVEVLEAPRAAEGRQRRERAARWWARKRARPSQAEGAGGRLIQQPKRGGQQGGGTHQLHSIVSFMKSTKSDFSTSLSGRAAA